MTDIIRKAILFGVGVYHISREKLENFVSELEKDGALTPAEGKKVVEDVMKQVDQSKDKVASEVERVVKRVLTEIRKEEAKNEPSPKSESSTATEPVTTVVATSANE